MKTDLAWNYDALREKLENQYQEAVYLPESGLEVEEISRKISEIYKAGEGAGEPFALTRANMISCVLENIRISVHSVDPFVGLMQRNYLSGHFPSRIRDIQWERIRQFGGAYLEDPRLKKCREEGLFNAQLDLSHTSPDWDNLLTLGIPGLLARAEELCAEQPSSPFAQSVAIVFRSFQNFLLRYAEAARREGRDDLEDMLRFLASHPPATLRQALQLGLLYRDVQEIEGEWVRSMGIFDRQYAPFYRRDLAEGRLTKESAEELLTIYFSRFHARSKGKDAGTPFCFGGYLPGKEGVDGCNEITELSCRAFRRLGWPDPKFQFRVNKKTPDALLVYLAECIKEGKSSVLLINEDVARPMFLRHGKEEQDLANFIPVGCYEPAIMGKELSSTMTVLYNFAKVGEMLFEDSSFDPQNFSEVESRYLEILKSTLGEALQAAIPWERLWNTVNPSPFLSGTMTECMRRGLDVSQYGTKYATSGVMCAGIGTAADILSAVEWLVFEKKMVRFQELGRILASNWNGAEELRLQAAKRAPKWGCGDERADRIAGRIVEEAARMIDRTPNAKGGFFQMGLWSIDLCLTFGRQMGATADGRYAQSPISKNSGSSIGCDKEGIAGLIESVTSLDHTLFADGTVLDIMLPPRTAAGEEGTAFLVRMIRSCFAKGGLCMHFNILSAETLKDAQAHPEKYRNLQVRLCGWNVRFTDLQKPMQDCLIQEAESKE